MIFLLAVFDFLIEHFIGVFRNLFLFLLICHKIWLLQQLLTNNNQDQLHTINMQQYYSYFDGLVADWVTPTTKKNLKERIKNRLKDKQIETTDQLLSEQYFRSWLDVPMTNPLQRLVRHPLLTQQDKVKIDEFVSDQQRAQLKYATMLCTGTLSIYFLFLRKSTTFQNFFNNRERYRVTNMFRKFLGVYGIFLGWMIILNSHYEKKIPQSLQEMGMFRKYRVLYEEKFA